MPIPDQDFMDRASRVIRLDESERAGIQHLDPPPPPDSYGLVVKVTGPREPIETEQSGSSETGSESGSGEPEDTLYVYPGVIQNRNIEFTDDRAWSDLDDCFIEEMNEGELEIGERYPGDITAMYLGLPLISVRASFAFSIGGSGGSGSRCDVRTDEFFRRSNNNCFYLAGCLGLVDDQGNPIPGIHIHFTPDPIIE